MEKEKAISKLTQKLKTINKLKTNPFRNEEFEIWRQNTIVDLKHIFGEQSEHQKRFQQISYSKFATVKTKSGYITDNSSSLIIALDNAKTMLISMIYEIENYGISTHNSLKNNTSLNKLELIFDKFHLVAKNLKKRQRERKALEITDEYDVQYLLKALLSLYFDDIRDEEWTPSYAGGSSRVDFCLKPEQIFIETKITRENYTDKQIANDLIIDKDRYRSHADCKILVCFVYDPDAKLKNPHGLEKDLSSSDNHLDVKVFIRPIH